MEFSDDELMGLASGQPPPGGLGEYAPILQALATELWQVRQMCQKFVGDIAFYKELIKRFEGPHD